MAFAVAGGAEALWEDVSRTTLFSAVANLPVTVLGFIADSKKKRTKPQFTRVEIRPGDATLRRGERTNFVATAFNGERPVHGTAFRWSATPVAGGESRQYSSGVFMTLDAGQFVVKATAEGREAQVLLTVVEDEDFTRTELLRKPAGERTEAENQQYREWLASGALVTRQLDSRAARAASGETIAQDEPKLRGPSDPGEPLFTAPPLGWDSGDWAAADDRINWVGNPMGAARDAGAGNGNFFFGAPAVSLPGRGLDLDLNLYYNSRVWSKTDTTEMKYDADSGFPAPGWSLGFGRLYFPAYPGGCTSVAPDGTRRSTTGATTYYSTSGGYTYHGYAGSTTDGSFIDYSCSLSQTPSYTSATGYSWHPDGTKITYGAGTTQLFPTYITDAHGNWIQITYKNNAGPEIDTIVDTLGRTITFNYNGSNRLIDITGPGFNGTTRTFLRLQYLTKTLSHDFGTMTTVVPDASPDLIEAIYYPTTDTGYWLPDASYSTYGMLAKVTAQRGMGWSAGAISAGTMTKEDTYNYPMTAASTLSDAPTYTTLAENWEGNDSPTITACNSASTNLAVTCYSVATATDEVITVTRPDGSKSKQTSFTGTGYNGGMWFQTEILNPSNAVLDKTKIYMASGAYSSPRTTKIEHTDDKSGTPQTSTTEFTYGSVYNQVSAQKEYGYGYSTLYREKRFTYENSTNYTNRHIFSLLKTAEDYDGAGNRLTRTEYDYDQSSLVPATGIVQHLETHDPYTEELVQGSCNEWDPDPPYFCSGWEWNNAYQATTAYRGNLTSVTTYETVDNSTSSGAITHNYTYDIAGNQRTGSTDCCQEISTVYSTATQFSRPDSQTRGSSNPSSPDRLTQTVTYDANTTLPISIVDYNGQKSTFSYDAISRPLVTTLNVTPTYNGATTTVSYNDSAMSRTELVQKSTAEGSGTVSNSTSYFNGRGQVNKTTYQAGTSNHNATSIKYDVMGRLWKVSRPYDSAGSPSDWSESAYDYLSRVTTQTAPDGSINSINYSPTAPSSAVSDVGSTVITSDAWGRQRWARNDAYGRLVEVVEPDAAVTTAAVSASGNLSTTYAYDTLDRLTTITQGVGIQTRSFKYDALGRMTRQKLAEQTATIDDAGTYVGTGGTDPIWSEAFVYDSRSNLTQRTDARGVKTNLSYLVSSVIDPLNRLQGITYVTSGADATYTINAAPAVSFEYMTTGDKTRVKKVITSGVVTEENTFDSEGRISEYKAELNSRTGYPFETDYTYDSAHRLTQIEYPKAWGMTEPVTSTVNPRKVVVPSYDVASRLTQMDVDSATYLNGVSYNTSGQVTQLTTGSSMANPRVEGYAYDSQTGLLTGQTVKNTAATTTYLDLTYSYARGNSHGSASGKTGQMTKILDNLSHSRDKLYEFDSLGRIMNAKGGVAAGASGRSIVADWTQSYSYDRYGNKTGVTASGITQDSNAVPADGLASVTPEAATNRLNVSTWTYDLTGNLIRGQNVSGTWQKFEYDAAGRLKKVMDDSNNVLETYTYGATREKLIVETSSQRTYYAWGGQSIVAEYTEVTASSTPDYSKSYIYAGSRLLMTATKASTTTETKEFHHPNRLGTELVTDGGAGTSYRQTTLPFGTALAAESTGNSNQVFTSYDRSATTGLDYATNRTYSKGQSRFTQVDPIGMSAASAGNPQSNNLYAYTQNMPTDFVDPSGLNMECGYRTLVQTMCIEGEGCSIVGIEFIYVCWGSSGGSGGGPTGIFDPGGGGGGGTQGPGPGITPPQTVRRQASIATCLKNKVQNRLNNVNHSREREMKRNILGSVAPSIVPAPFGWFSPFPDVQGRPLRDQTDDDLTRNYLIGMWNPESLGPIGAGMNILVAGLMEGTYGRYNHSQAVSGAKTVTQSDRDDCAGKASNIP